MAPRDYALYFNYGSIILVLERSFYAADSLFFYFFYLFMREIKRAWNMNMTPQCML